jgi:hypothetical protein
MNARSLDELAAAFRACTLAKAEWTHVAHLSVGAWHVHHFGAERALEILRPGIRRLNDHHGTANTPTGGYHETITAAYVHLIADFLTAFEADLEIERRVAFLIDGPLGERSALLAFWSKDCLMSERARAEWVPPDLAPLVVPPAALANIGRRAPP